MRFGCVPAATPDVIVCFTFVTVPPGAELDALAPAGCTPWMAGINRLVRTRMLGGVGAGGWGLGAGGWGLGG